PRRRARVPRRRDEHAYHVRAATRPTRRVGATHALVAGVARRRRLLGCAHRRRARARDAVRARGSLARARSRAARRPMIGSQAQLRTRDGRALPVPADRWFGGVCAAERRLLDRVCGPVLDIGCGPARHVLMLAESGIVTLGIDISPPTLALA